jgi:hypothetical protein
MRCRLLAQSGHQDRAAECPLLGVKRTLRFQGVMSAFDPKRTLTPPFPEQASLYDHIRKATARKRQVEKENGNVDEAFKT